MIRPHRARTLRTFSLALAAVTLGCCTAASAGAAATTKITTGVKVDDPSYAAYWRSVVSIQHAYGSSPVSVEDDSAPIGARVGDQDAHFCGGTLIASDIVLTAAHCADGIDTDAMTGETTRVVIGTPNLGADRASSSTTSVAVDAVRIHPSWVENAGEQPGRGYAPMPSREPVIDLALLHLSHPVDGVPFVPLAPATTSPQVAGGVAPGERALVAGWGATDPLIEMAHSSMRQRVLSDEPSDETPRRLRAVALTPLGEDRCETTSGPMGDSATAFDRRSMLCAYGRDTIAAPARSNRRGACFGDSGGPLVTRSASGAQRLIGVVSWGPSRNGGCNAPSVFARVDTSRAWIDETAAELHAGGAAASTLGVATIVEAHATGYATGRVTWRGAPGAPARYAVLYQILPRDMAATHGIRLGAPEKIAARVDAPISDVRTWLASSQLVTTGSTGVQDTGFTMRDLLPRRANDPGWVRVRIRATDMNGHSSYSQPFVFRRALDPRPPSAPRARLVTYTGHGPEGVAWAPSGDNDRVVGYVVERRKVGSSRWLRDGIRISWASVSRSPFGMIVMPGITSFGPDGASSGYARHSYIETTEADDEQDRGDLLEDQDSNAYIAWNAAPGSYDVRVSAFDRAGNRSISHPLRIRVRSLMRLPTYDQICLVRSTRVRCHLDPDW